MEKLQLPHAKLLYFVSELWKQQEITDSEKLTLKERIISDEPKIFELLDTYESDGNLIQLKNQVIGLVRAKVEPKLPAQNPMQGQNNGKQVNHNDEADQDADDDEEDDNANNGLTIPNFSSAPQDNKDEVSSPLGNALFNKKKTKAGGIGVLKDFMKPVG